MENNIIENKIQGATQRIHPLIIRNTAIVESELSFSVSDNHSHDLPPTVENRKHPSTRREEKIEEENTLEEETFKDKVHRSLVEGIGKKVKVMIYVLFLIAMIGNGSAESQGTKKAF